MRDEPKKVSILGIISTVIAILIGAGIFTVFIIAGYLEATTPGGVSDKSPTAIIIGLAAIFALAVNALGVILGAVGVFQRNTNKLFAVVGIMLNLLILLTTFGLIALGLWME